FQDFADPKTSADLHEFAARDYDFVFLLSEMTDDQNDRGRAVVYDSGHFRLSEEGEGALAVITTGAAVWGGKIEFQIIIGGSGDPERFACALRKGRSTEVGVNDDAGAVDHRLNSTRAKFLKRRLDKIDNCGELRDFTAS